MSAETVDNFLALAGTGASWSRVALVGRTRPSPGTQPSASFGRVVVSGPGIANLAETLANLRKAS